MSVESRVLDRKNRSFFSGRVVDGCVDGGGCSDVLKDELLDCPPGFEKAACWGLGFGGLMKAGMHGEDLCEIGDELSFSSGCSHGLNIGNDTENRIGDVVDCNVVDTINKPVASDFKAEILSKVDKVRRKGDAMPVKSEFVTSSLVWGKIRNHLWWPGQIFDTADSSKEALLHYKEGKLLVAYFGDGTFAWNDDMQMRPFQLNYEQMESQSDIEVFCRAVECALDEVFRRVVFGLSCACLPDNVYVDIQSQIVDNLGVYRKTRRRDVRDECSNADSFVPSTVVSYVKEAAMFCRDYVNKLELVKCKAQLTSFCRWKGYRKPPEFAYFRGLPDINAEFTNLDGKDSSMAMACNAGHVPPPKFAITEGQVEPQKRRRGRPKGTSTARQKKKKKVNDLMDNDELYVPHNHVKARRKPKRKMLVEDATSEQKMGTSISKSRKKSISGSLSPSGLPTQLALTATDPLNDHDPLIPFDEFFSQFRNSNFLNHSVLTEPDKSLEKKSYERINGMIPESRSRTLHSESVEDFSMDRIVKESAENRCFMDSHDEPVKNVAEHSCRAALPILGSENVPQLHILPDMRTQDASDHQMFTESILDTPSNQVPDNHKDKTMQTALLLRFSEHNPVPSVTHLNEIFSCYGPLQESETKIMKRSVAKVVFKRKCDAEAAFSSTGKYRFFGPLLLSYRLKYQIAKPKNISPQVRKRRKKSAPI